MNRHASHTFRAAEGGAAIIEFAMACPLLLALMVGGLQLVNYVNATRRVELIASSISQMLSQAMPPTGSTTATVSAADLHFAYDSSLVLFPYIMQDGPRQGIGWWQDISINFAGIQFTQTAANCTNTADMSGCYTANVAWTTGAAFTSNFRPCTPPQTPINNTSAPSRYALPRSVFGPGSIIAVDVLFTFRPTFGSRFLPSTTITRSIFVQPRYAAILNYDTTNSDGIGMKCPGY